MKRPIAFVKRSSSPQIKGKSNGLHNFDWCIATDVNRKIEINIYFVQRFGLIVFAGHL